MDNRINDFINTLLPDDVKPDKKEELKQELESHIFDTIDFYVENGFSYEKSIDKALADFCDDEKTKKKIKNKFTNLHSERSIAHIVIKIYICFTILNLILHFSVGYMPHLGIFNVHILIPSIPLSLLVIIERIKKINLKARTVFSIIIAIILCLYGFDIMIFGFSDKITIEQENVEEYYSKEKVSFYFSDDTEKEISFLPLPEELEGFTSSTYYHFTIESIFSEPSTSTYIFTYSVDDYSEKKNLVNEKYKNYIKSKSLYNFNFKYFSPCYTDENFDKEHYYPTYYSDDKDNVETYDTSRDPAVDTLYCIGTNDKTNQIAIICHYTQWYDLELLEEPISESIVIDGKETEKCFEFKPVNSSVDEYFYTDFCGWKYISFFNFFLK